MTAATLRVTAIALSRLLGAEAATPEDADSSAHDDQACNHPGRGFGEMTVTVTAAAGAITSKKLKLATKGCK